MLELSDLLLGPRCLEVEIDEIVKYVGSGSPAIVRTSRDEARGDENSSREEEMLS